MFVKFSCGCIGFPPNTEGKSVIVKACDGEGEICFYDRFITHSDGSPKSFEPLDSDTDKSIQNDISRTIQDGHKWFELKLLLK